MSKKFASLQLIVFGAFVGMCLFPTMFQGMFIGADLALALAGFLFITSVLDEFILKQKNYWQTFLQIFLKLWLILIGLILLVLPVAWLINKNYLVDGFAQVLAVLSFTTNIYLQQLSGGTFVSSEPALFSYLWPVSIAIQGMLVLGILLTLFSWQKQQLSINQLRRQIFLGSFILFLVSLVWLLGSNLLNQPVTSIFYSSIAHSLPFFLGCFLGSFTGGQMLVPKFAKKNSQMATAKVQLVFGFLFVLFLVAGLVLTLQQRGTYYWLPVAASLSVLLVFVSKILIEQQALFEKVSEKIGNTGFWCCLFFWPLYDLLASRLNHLLAGLLAILCCIVLVIIRQFWANSLAGSVQKLGQFVISKRETKIGLLATFVVLAIFSVAALFKAPEYSSLAAETSETNFATSVDNLTGTYASLGNYINQELQTEWQTLAADSQAQVDIAIYSPTYEQTFTFTNGTADTNYYVASIIKVAILVEVLHQTQVNETSLSASEENSAVAMIENSDNTAATYFIHQLGGFDGVTPLFESLGMNSTITDLTGWGLSKTTADDQLKLLNEIFYSGDYLTAENKAYVQELMGNVIDEQVWGVSTGAPLVQLKNGWDYSDEDLWTVNSMGHVYSETDSAGYTIVILANQLSSFEEGETLIEALAQKTGDLLA